VKLPKWSELSARDRRQALLLIRIEQTMWRTGKGTNWHPLAVDEAKRNYRVLGAALRALKGNDKP